MNRSMKSRQRKLKKILSNNKDQAFMSKELATIEVHAPITVSLNDLDFVGRDEEEVIQHI